MYFRREMGRVELKEEDRGVENQWVRSSTSQSGRRSSYSSSPVPRPPSRADIHLRPNSAKTRPKSAKRRGEHATSPRPASRTVRDNAWTDDSQAEETGSQSTNDASVQTGGELLKHYDPVSVYCILQFSVPQIEYPVAKR